ncbi:MAG: hypothetical protein WCS70_04565 [Verrucomicrobiota bacterium]
MRIVKISDEACKALEQLGVPFEQIGVVTTSSEPGSSSQPTARPVQPRPRGLSDEEVTLRPNHKAVGAENRRQYLQQLRQRGLSLEHERRTAYLTPHGNRVVLALANHPWSPGKWFLGAPKEFFNKPNTALILICKELDKFLDFVFPPKDIQKLVPMLTEVRGELRFNVRRDDGIYYIYRPGVDKMEISQFLNKYESLKGL